MQSCTLLRAGLRFVDKNLTIFIQNGNIRPDL